MLGWWWIEAGSVLSEPGSRSSRPLFKKPGGVWHGRCYWGKSNFPVAFQRFLNLRVFRFAVFFEVHEDVL